MDKHEIAKIIENVEESQIPSIEEAVRAVGGKDCYPDYVL